MSNDIYSKAILKIGITRYKDGIINVEDDILAVEEPLEIRISYGPLADRNTKSIAVTMRTPGHDIELSLGFLFTEGILQSREQIIHAAHAARAKTTTSRENIVQILLKENVEPDLQKLQRNFYTTSSCGVCGKESIDAIKVECPVYPSKTITASAATILSLPIQLREEQNLFESTGGIHAAALFDLKGRMLLLHEDVGRHNALDKLIGAALFSDHEKRMDLTESILLLSGRASFELLQKAAMAGIPVVCAVGAPSSLAVQIAQEFCITLIGFLKTDRFNIYCGKERIIMV